MWTPGELRMIEGIKDLPSFNQAIVDAMEQRKDRSPRLRRYIMDVIRATKNKADAIFLERYGE